MNRSTLAFGVMAACLLTGFVSPNALAQPSPGGQSLWINDGNNGTAFPRGRVNRLGYQINVRLSAPDIPETQRVEIDFMTTGGPTTADLNFTLLLSPRGDGHSPPQSALEVEIPFQIPEKSTQQTIVRHVPKTSYGDAYEVSILENGQSITPVPNEIGKSLQRYTAINEGIRNELRWRLIWINSEQDQDLREKSLQSLIESTFDMQWDADVLQPEQLRVNEDGRVNEPFVAVQSHAPDELPLDWRSWLPFDAVVIHREDYLKFQAEQPSWWKPLMQWVRGGGVILIRGTPPEQKNDIQRISSSASTLDAATIDAYAISALQSLRTGAAEMSNNWGRMYAVNQQVDEATQRGIDAIEKFRRSFANAFANHANTRLGTEMGMQAFPLQAGLLIQLPAHQDDEPVSILDWRTTKNLLGFHAHRTLRRGVDPMIGTQRFFEWMIPGVSQPPVYTFMGFLGLFVILVGPVAYRKTTKSGRSYLMFLIAPVLAIATTVAMMGYGIIADGFGTRLRARQITWANADGDAMSRTRSTYFAGIRPSNGLRFPANASVTLLLDNEETSWEDRINQRFDPRGTVSVTDDEIRFSSRLLPSRQQRQFVVEQPRDQFGTVRITKSESDAVKRVSVELKNECELDLQSVLIRDQDGLFFLADDVSSGESARAKLVTSLDASKLMGDWYKRQWLVNSKTNRQSDSTNGQARRRLLTETFDVINKIRSTLGLTAAPTDGVFEYELQQRMQLGKSLPNRSYIALAELSDDVPAIEGISIENSIHFVMGDLP
ncbi:putative signal peptide and transmembrane protein [Rhodopirellula islandica]|uniref:Signal peptide and transmembrane protein n=1 Tax=Rhodopirellula islandica TaxID=595434 RepID=A0A0J1B5U3_RHOIS|nr:hypothetical protein [Rhodopirellula islandica]KLU02102.1 putative signal peptide and transmembrane protein [Rhodopirellula islandica]